IRLAALILAASSAARAEIEDRQRVTEFLDNLNVHGYTIREITDDYVNRSFPNFTFFGVIFRQYPVARLCPEQQGLACANIFFVHQEEVGFAPNISELRSFFFQKLCPVPGEEAASDAGRSWLRFSSELKQDLFFMFSSPSVEYSATAEGATVAGQ